MNDPGCIECLSHIVQWSELADENEQLKSTLRQRDRIANRLRRKIASLQRRLDLADQLLEQQDALLTTLVQN